MKIGNLLMQVGVISFTLIMSTCLYGQHPHKGRGHHPPPSLTTLQEELDLSDEQVKAIKELEESYTQKREALRDREEDQRPDREAIHQLRKAQREAINALLSKEQIDKLEQLHQERERRHQKRFNSEEHKAFRERVKTYRQENILPVMAAQRLKLEPLLEEEDRQKIDELRSRLEGLHKKGERTEKFSRKDHEANRKRIKAHRADFEEVRALVLKYDQPITRLLEEIKPQAEKWQKDIRAMHEALRKKDSQEGMEDPRPHHHPKGMRQGGERMRKGHFLLMDPANPRMEESSATEEPLFTIFPNPAVNDITLEFELAREATVRIEIRDERGSTILQVEKGHMKAGAYKERLDLGQLDRGVYYCSLTIGERINTRTISITR
jgi:hypothetical protein